MSILKYKYKAHKFINYAFYLVVFIAGFLIGFGTKKLDFNKLISQFLMIDNVSAYNISNSYINIENAEEHVLNNIPTSWKSNFNFEEYPYVIIKTTNYSNSKCVFAIYFFKNLDTVKFGAGSYDYSFQFSSNSDYYSYKLNKDGGICQTGGKGGTASGSIGSNTYSNKEYYTNFDITDVSTYSNTSSYTDEELNNRIHLLDFAGSNLKFNENLFKDNPDFKQVCVNPDTRFAITSNNITYNDEETELKYFNAIDFIWFSYVPDGLTTYLYSSTEETKKTPLTEDGPLFNGINPGYWYYLDEKEEIDKFFNTDSSKGEIYPGVTLELEGYTDKYSYFGWYFHPFVVHFDNTQDGNNFFNVFHFKDKLNFYSILENGLDYYEELENARNGNICFYIKNDYDITILNKDIFDDDIGETTILGGDKLDINTSENSSSLNSKGLFSKINLFINNIKDTILFINGYIYELYVSLPNIVQLFIISVFGLIVVSILVRMVTK